MNTSLYQIIFLIGAIVLLVVSIAWADFIITLSKTYSISHNPVIDQFAYMLIVTFIGAILILFLKPFGPGPTKGPENPLGVEQVLRDIELLPL